MVCCVYAFLHAIQFVSEVMQSSILHSVHYIPQWSSVELDVYIAALYMCAKRVNHMSHKVDEFIATW